MLYIRTQEKLSLLPLQGRIELNIYDKNDICVMDIDNVWVQLGIYKTKERALEVLEEIEYMCNGATRIIKQQDVYQMPKE